MEAKDDLVYAKDCKCCKCGKQAVAFWPVFDPDIPYHPFCRTCLDKEKIKALKTMLKHDEKYR